MCTWQAKNYVSFVTKFSASWVTKTSSCLSYFRVDFVKYPSLKDVEYFKVTMEPGDCIFIPYKWWVLRKLYFVLFCQVHCKEVLSRKYQGRFPFSKWLTLCLLSQLQIYINVRTSFLEIVCFPCKSSSQGQTGKAGINLSYTSSRDFQNSWLDRKHPALRAYLSVNIKKMIYSRKLVRIKRNLFVNYLRFKPKPFATIVWLPGW